MRLQGRALGSTIGAVGGVSFVLANAGGLPGGTVLRVAALVLFAVTVVAVLRADVVDPPPSPHALRTYLVCVGVLVVAIPAGEAVLRALDRSELVLPWVVLVLGAHFVPFARAFTAPVFLVLGLAEIAVAVVGGAVTLATGQHDVPLWTAVAAGFLLLGSALTGVLRASGPVRPAQTRG